MLSPLLTFFFALFSARLVLRSKVARSVKKKKIQSLQKARQKKYDVKKAQRLDFKKKIKRPIFSNLTLKSQTGITAAKRHRGTFEGSVKENVIFTVYCTCVPRLLECIC